MTVGDYLISFFVVCLVLFAAWRGGQVNPVGTGRLARRIGELEMKVGEHGARLDGIETKVGQIANTVLQTNTAIEALRIETASDRGLTERTWSAVDRLQNYFIQQSFERRDRP